MTMQSKRKLITLAKAAALLVASVAIAEAQPQGERGPSVDRHHDPLIGTWIVRVVPRGRPEFMAISTFNLGGTFAQVDTNSGVTAALGQWVRTGDRTYSNDFLLFGNPLTATTTVQVDLTLSETLDTFTAAYEFQSVAPDGTVLVMGGGTREGRRATFEFQ